MDIKILSFNKEKNGRWYIDLPTWDGEKADLEMVAGADELLDVLSGKGNHVKIMASEEYFDDAEDCLVLDELGNGEFGGGYYNCKAFKPKRTKNIWLCFVTKFVFGDSFPKEIWFKDI